MARMRWGALVVVCALGGCGGGGGGMGLVGSGLPEEARGGCRLAKSGSGVIVTEWSATEKANLEAMTASGGGVAVELSGCEMRIVTDCQLGGEYEWQRTTPARDTIEISDQRELQAKLPLGVASLSGELQRSGTLLVETTVAGQRLLSGAGPDQVPAGGACKRATHIVNAVALGAFALRATGDASGSASASVARVGETGARSSRVDRIVKSAGLPDQCGAATPDGPHTDCSSPLQVFLSPIPGRVEEEGPPGSIKADFLAGDSAVRWDVYLADEPACTTPCSKWISPHEPIFLKERTSESFFAPKPDKLNLSQIGAGAPHVQVRAHKVRQGRRVTGIVGTALGGIAVIAGAALAGIGCPSDDDDFGNLCTPGIVTGGIGAAITVGGIYLILTSGARTEVTPVLGTSF